MAVHPKRAVLIGLDGANYEAMKPLLRENRLPNLAKLLQGGTLFENAYAPYPTLTGSNWGTIATGAWPGTHGVTDMSYHVTGEPVDYWHSGFTSDAVEAETLWEALTRVGKQSIVLKYTGSWPPRHPSLTMIDGGGGRPFWGGSILELSHSQLFSTELYPNGIRVQVSPATGWAFEPESTRPALQFRLEYRPMSRRVLGDLQFEGEHPRIGEPIHWWGIILAAGDAGYDTIALCTEKDYRRVWTALRTGEWSESLELQLKIEHKLHRGHVRILLEQLDPESGAFSLYFSQVYPTDAFSQPAELGADLVRRFGAYVNHPAFSAAAMQWVSIESFVQMMEYQNEWLGSAGRYLMETRQWELFAMQCHCIDFANHAFVPRHGWSSEEKQANLAYLARCYESVDRMVGDLLAGAGDETLICVVSDHGATESPNPEVFINAILEEAGLLMHKQQQPGAVRPEIDRSLTIAEQQRAAFIYINLQGRDPGGIVPPEQYEAVRDRIIATLRDYREPTTGRNPFSMILRKEDARILGLYDSLGRDIGDIVYALLPEFDHEHGRQLPGATLGGQTMKPLLTFHGPGIKGGAVLGRTAWLVDVVPTLAYALGWPLPSETEGAVLYQAFTEHSTNFPRSDFMQQQEKRLRAVQKRLVDRAGAARPVTDVTTEAETETEESSVEDEPLSETVSELQTALRQARAEARKWKSAYEQYHRITHGN